MRRLALVLLAASVATSFAAAAGCSLGLDPSLINRSDAGAQDSSVPVDGPEPSEGAVGDAPADARTDTSKPVDAAPGGDAGACSTDKDCQGYVGDGGGCVSSAKCDPTWHVCMLDVCGNAATCSAAVCETSSQTCSLPASYGFQATHFTVSYGGVGPWGPGRSIAAVWPYVFVVTSNGIVAYDVFDPTATSPTEIPVHGVPFLPGTAISVGRRVYFVTSPQGPGPTYHEAVAWIDVPQNPFLTSLDATSAWLSDANTSFDTVFADGVDGLFFVYSSSPLWPTADLHPPFSDSTVVTSYPNNNFPMNEGIWGYSGNRLWGGRYDGTSNMFKGSFVTKPGTSSAVTSSELAITGPGKVDNQAYSRTGDDGSVLASFAQYALDDAGSPTGIATSCLTWLVDSSTAGNFDAAKCTVVESYSPTVGNAVVGPPGWIDGNTALALAGASSNPGSSTSVHVVTKNPAAVVAGKVAYIPVDTASVGVATSNGFGYVLAQDDSKNQTCSVYVFAPGCGGGGD